jgi:hypothetical protein
MKKNLFRIILPALILCSSLFLIQSCAVESFPSKPITFNKDSSEKGLLVGSVTFPQEKARFNGYYFRLTGNTSAEFQIKPAQISKLKHKGQIDGGKTYLFIIERPVGKYEIPSVRLFGNSGMIAMQSTKYVGGFSIPYEIKKGEITYIGNINFNEYAEKGEKIITLENKYNRDIEALKTLQPSIDWKDVKNDESRKIEYNDKKARL